MRGGPEYAARIKCAGQDGPIRGVRALCGTGLNGTGRPALPPQGFTMFFELFDDFAELYANSHVHNFNNALSAVFTGFSADTNIVKTNNFTFYKCDRL